MGSNYIPLNLMIQFAVKVAMLVVPETYKPYNESEWKFDWFKDSQFEENDKLALMQICQYRAIEKLYICFEGLKPKSLCSYILDFLSYDFLYELLTLSVKLSFAGDEINGKLDWERLISEIWNIVWNSQASTAIYSFIAYMKYKLESKLQIASTNNNAEIFQRTSILLSSISEKFN